METRPYVILAQAMGIQGVLCLQYDVEYFAKKLMSYFNGLESKRKEFSNDDGTVLGHCFFPDVLNRPLEKLLETDSDTSRIKKYVAFIEDMYMNGDCDVKNIVVVSLREYHALGYEKPLKNLYKYLSPTLQAITKEIENSAN